MKRLHPRNRGIRACQQVRIIQRILRQHILQIRGGLGIVMLPLAVDQQAKRDPFARMQAT